MAAGRDKPGSPSAHALSVLFEPRHIAVVGASRTPGKHGNTVVRNLLAWGYRGRIFPVNPAGEDVEGLACYPTIADVPEPPDCAFLVIPGSACTDAVRDCAARGVRSIVVAATGFAEAGTDKGIARQSEIAAICRAHGVRLLGPNTNGYLNAEVGASLGYNTSHSEVTPAGPIAIASHSGALFNAIARRLAAHGTNLGKFVAIGNEAEVSILDVLDYLIEDDSTRVIGLLIEGLSDGPRFRALAMRARALRKPIVALKLGRSAAGAGSSQAHSSRLAGKARAYDALFEACGIAPVTSLEALCGGCALLARFNPADAQGDQSLICVATSGAGGTLTVDFAAARGIPLAGEADGEWPERVKAALAAVPDISPMRNPIDSSTLNGDRSRLLPVLRTLAAQGYRGPVAAFSHVGARKQQDEKMARALIARLSENPAPIILIAPGHLMAETEALYAEAGIPLFHDMTAGFDSLFCYYAALASDMNVPVGRIAMLDEEQQAAIARCLDRSPHGVVSELDSAEILRLAGVPMVASRRVASVAAARSAAEGFGFPVVVKAQPAGVAHKDKLGLVRIGIADAEALARAFDELTRAAARQGFATADLDIVVQPMVASRLELLAGISNEPGLGPFLVFGLGGVHTEVLDAVELLPIPSNTAAIRSGLARSRAGRMLAATGNATAATEQFIGIIEALQRLAHASPGRISSIDVNPVMVSPGGCLAVDALIVTT